MAAKPKALVRTLNPILCSLARRPSSAAFPIIQPPPPSPIAASSRPIFPKPFSTTTTKLNTLANVPPTQYPPGSSFESTRTSFEPTSNTNEPTRCPTQNSSEPTRYPDKSTHHSGESTRNSGEPPSTTTGKPRRNTLVNFSDSDEPTQDSSESTRHSETLPPPYDPFNKKPAIEEPEDATNLQEVFYKMKKDGLTNSAVKMFDALSKDGLTHEALELFVVIKDKGEMPDVIAHTAVIEAYANAGKAKDALRGYLRMLGCGVLPNAYTYTVLIKGLARSGDAKLLGEAKKYLLEMMEKDIRPNAGTYVSVFEAFVKNGQEEEGRELFEKMKTRGFRPDEKAVRESLQDKRGPSFRTVSNILFGK